MRQEIVCAAAVAAGMAWAGEGRAEVHRVKTLYGSYSFEEAEMPEGCIDWAVDSLSQAIGDAKHDCQVDFGSSARFAPVTRVQTDVDEVRGRCKAQQTHACYTPRSR